MACVVQPFEFIARWLKSREPLVMETAVNCAAAQLVRQRFDWVTWPESANRKILLADEMGHWFNFLPIRHWVGSKKRRWISFLQGEMVAAAASLINFYSLLHPTLPLWADFSFTISSFNLASGKRGEGPFLFCSTFLEAISAVYIRSDLWVTLAGNNWAAKL